MTNFKLVENFLGYQTKKDVTNVDARYLVAGSQNVLVNDGEKIVTRKGYSLDGDASAVLTPIESSYDWDTSTNVTRNLRAFDDELQYRYVASDGTVTWRKLADGFTSALFQFDSWWNTTEKKDVLLFVNGSPNVYSWYGGITTLASSTVNTLTKEGSTTWAQERFLTAGTRQVVIDGITYTYTGGENTTTLTGVTPDPTAGAHAVGAVVHQAIATDANTVGSGFDISLVKVLKNQAYFGDLENRDVYISKNTDFTDFAFSNPRVPGEGMLLTLDSVPTGFEIQEDAMYISGGKNDWYQVVFTLSADNTSEAITIEKLKSGSQQAAQSQNLIAKIKNSVIFISNEPTLDTLGRIENVDTPQSVPLSDPIENTFTNYDFTGGQIKYHKNVVYIALPIEGIVLMYDLQNQYWQPPQTLPVSCFSVIDGNLYGHSSSVAETYKLFDSETRSDNANPINFIAKFAYRNMGERDKRKRFDEYYHEGYITLNSEINVTYLFDYQGSATTFDKTIDPDETNILFGSSPDVSLGTAPLGSQPLGTSLDETDPLTKFRTIHTLDKQGTSHFEYQVEYSSNEEDYEWHILAQGPNSLLSTSAKVDIKT